MNKIDIREIEILAQLIEAMSDSLEKLETSYNKKNIEKFNENRRILLDFQGKISDILK